MTRAPRLYRLRRRIVRAGQWLLALIAGVMLVGCGDYWSFLSKPAASSDCQSYCPGTCAGGACDPTNDNENQHTAARRSATDAGTDSGVR